MSTANVTQTGGAATVAVTVSRGLKGDTGATGAPGTTDYNELDNVPGEFPPEAHTHPVSDITPISSGKLVGRHGVGSGAGQEIGLDGGLEFHGANIRREALTGDVTAAAGSNSTTIANDAVTNARLANVPTATIKGRITAGTGDPEDLTPAQAIEVIGAASPASVEAQIDGRIAPRRTRPDGGMFSAIRLALDANRSVDIAVVGDSLGNGADEYAEAFALHLAAAYPGHRLVRRLIAENASASVREWTETVLQAADGEAYWSFPADNTGVQGLTMFGEDFPTPTGDFDLEFRIRADDWDGNSGTQLAAVWGTATPRLTRVYQVRIISSNRLAFDWYDASGNFRNAVTANLGVVGGAVTSAIPALGTVWNLRVRFDVDNGSGGSSVTFGKSTDNGGTWTDMTTVTVASTTGIWNLGADRDKINGVTLGGQPTVALKSFRIYDALIRHGHGTKVLSRRPVDYASIGSVSNNVTLEGSPTIWLHNYSYPGRTTKDLRSDLLGIAPIATATATGAVTGDGDMTVTVTAAGLTGSPLALNVPVLNGDTTTVWAGKVRAALDGNAAVTALFDVTGFGASIQLEHLAPQANDATLSIALATGTATGITSTSSTITTTGNPRHVDRLFGNFGAGIMFFHGGINDQWAGDFTGGQKRWVRGVKEIVESILARNDDLIPILIATNPKTGVDEIINDHATLRSSLMSALARRENWGFADVRTAFYDDGRDLTILIPDGTHPSTTAYTEIWNPLITEAFSVESA